MQQNPEFRPLAALDIGAEEETLYGALLDSGGASRAELGHRLGWSTRNVQRLLDRLEAKGLVTHSPQPTPRYLPAAPDIALESLVLKRQEDLQRARGEIARLQERGKARANDREQLLELITSREAERQVLEQLQRSAMHEVMFLQRPPVRITTFGEVNQPQHDALARGIRYRGISDREFLEQPGAAASLLDDIAAGEDVRVVSRLPFKMIAVDRRVAMLPLDLGSADGPVLLIRSSALLDALCALFEIFWERAAPVDLSSDAMPDLDSWTRRPSEQSQNLLRLLAAGLNDKSIAHELGVSGRTVERRVVELMNGLDARTRFQAGWLAARAFAAVTAVDPER